MKDSLTVYSLCQLFASMKQTFFLTYYRNLFGDVTKILNVFDCEKKGWLYHTYSCMYVGPG